MVVLLREAGRGQTAVRVQDRLREARRSGGEVDRGVVFARELDVGRLVGGVHREAMERFREGGTVFADEEERFDIGQLVADRLDSSDEFGSEDEIARIGEPEAVFDFVRGVAEVQRHGDRARLENPEVDREPFEAVHEQNRDLVSLFDPAAQEQIREAVGEFVELLPRRGAAQSDRMTRRLDEIEVFPRDAARRVLRLGREFDEADVGTVKERVSLENFGDGGQFCNRRKFALHYTRLRKSRPSRAAKIGNRLNRKKQRVVSARRAFAGDVISARRVKTTASLYAFRASDARRFGAREASAGRDLTAAPSRRRMTASASGGDAARRAGAREQFRSETR